jgi:hypothetical protein
MVRAIINLILLALIAFVGWYFIAPNIICWQDGGTWMTMERICNLGTVQLGADGLMPKLPYQK